MNAKTPPPATTQHSKDVQDLIHTLTSASDGKVAAVVEYLDTVPARDTAEIFVSPLRPRLRHMNVRRRYDMSRLLVMPLEPLLTETHGWKPGDPAIPRSVVRPMAAVMTAPLAPDREGLDRMLAQLDGSDPGAIVSLGSRVWPTAARALADAPAPTTGINGVFAQDYGQILRMASAVMAQAKVVEAVAVEARLGSPPEKDTLLAILRRAARFGPDGFAAQLKVLLGRLPASEEILAAAREAAASDPALRRAARGALALVDKESRP